jgi:hypothetical protein
MTGRRALLNDNKVRMSLRSHQRHGDTRQCSHLPQHQCPQNYYSRVYLMRSSDSRVKEVSDE